jgi:hypothetical protein
MTNSTQTGAICESAAFAQLLKSSQLSAALVAVCVYK